MANEFSNYPDNFNITGLKELKDFVGTRAQLYALINKNNPLAIIDKRQAVVFVEDSTYVMIMQKVQGGMRLRMIWKLGSNGGEYFIQDNIYRETPEPVIING